MVTVPRYTGSLGRDPIRSGRTLKTGTAGAEALMQLGSTLSNELLAYNERKIEIEKQFRETEIKNKGLRAYADTQAAILSAEDYLRTQSDYKTFDSEYKKRWKRNTDRIVKDHFTSNGVFDEYAFRQYEANHGNLAYVDGLQKVNNLINERRIAETITSFDTATKVGLESLDRSKTKFELETNYKILTEELNAYNGILSADAVIETKNNIEATANRKILLLQSGGGTLPTMTDPLGNQRTDWGLMFDNLNNKIGEYTDINGNVLTVDSDAYQSTLDFLKEQSVNQQWRIATEIERNNNDLFETNYKKVLNEGLTVSEINKLSFSKDGEGVRLKQSLSDLAMNKYQGLIPNESDVDIFRDVRKMSLQNKIKSLHEKSYIPSANSKFAKDEEYKEGMSILDLVNEGAISENDLTRISGILESPMTARELQDLDRLIDRFIPQVQGLFKDKDLSTGRRVYEFETLVEQAYEEGKYVKEIPASELLDPFSDNFIITDDLIDKYAISVNKQAENIANMFSKNVTEKKQSTYTETNGPQWDDANKAKFNNDFDLFYNSEEVQEWIKNNPELFEQEEMDLISIDSNTMIKDTKTMNGTTFNIYLNETVDPRPNPTIMIKPNVYRDNPDYLAWNKLFERTHTPDGKLK